MELLVCYIVPLKARDMVGLVNKFAAKMEEKKGSVSEDEVRNCRSPDYVVVFYCHHDVCVCVCVCTYLQTVQFKSYLLSVGIANPVTR